MLTSHMVASHSVKHEICHKWVFSYVFVLNGVDDKFPTNDLALQRANICAYILYICAYIRMVFVCFPVPDPRSNSSSKLILYHAEIGFIARLVIFILSSYYSKIITF